MEIVNLPLFAAAALVLSPFVRHSLRRYLSVPSHDDLVVLKELVDAGKLTPVIDGTYPLSETHTALSYIEGGHARGKVVVTLQAGSRTRSRVG